MHVCLRHFEFAEHRQVSQRPRPEEDGRRCQYKRIEQGGEDGGAQVVPVKHRHVPNQRRQENCVVQHLSSAQFGEVTK